MKCALALSVLLSFVLPSFVAMLVALFVSSVAFWLAHVRYRDFASTVLVLLLGFTLGIAYVATSSLGVVALAHALYDIAVVLIMRIQMACNPDYFDGPAPDCILMNLDDESPTASDTSEEGKGGSQEA